MKLLTTSLGLMAAGFIGLASTPAAAQTASTSPQAIPSWYTGSADPCPSGWRRNGRMCENRGSGEAIFPITTRGTPCPSGFATFNQGVFCIQGADTQLTRSSRGTITKVRRNDRCPIGYFTNNEAPMTCITQYQAPPSVRLKGAGPCRAGEVEDWGLYCVSDYARLTRDDAYAAGTRDWNDIYVTSDLKGPNQENVMDDSSYTPAYITIFGRVKRDGSPIGSTAAAAPAAAPAAAAAPPPRDTRVGSLSPQRRTATTFGICPAHWYAGQENSNLPDPNTCFPSQMATPIFPVASQEAPCPENYRNMVSWCVAANRNMPTTQAAAQSSAQTPANCPAPSSGGAQQMGAALGGLLGGRRGNSQAASALGGLLGAAAGQAAKPAGCP
jgi:hypothetical protein